MGGSFHDGESLVVEWKHRKIRCKVSEFDTMMMNLMDSATFAAEKVTKIDMTEDEEFEEMLEHHIKKVDWKKNAKEWNW